MRTGIGKGFLVSLASFVSLHGDIAGLSGPAAASAQTLSQRGFVEGTARLFPQDAPNDRTRAVGDVLVREEAFYKPVRWVQFAAGLDLRAHSHGHVEDEWRVDWSDRRVRQPRASIRRLSATIAAGRFSLDVGKQFIRWGKTDIVTPTDRFAPRDFLDVVDNEFLAVTAVRGVALLGGEALEVVLAPRVTPSRLPLLDERWTGVPDQSAGLPLVDSGSVLPSRAQAGVRWSHAGDLVEYSLSYFDGFNHLPNIHADLRSAPLRIDVVREYPPVRAYGVDVAAPAPWLTVKAEAAYFTSSSLLTDEYVLYVVQLERQTGEWVFVGGYAGEAVTRRRAALTFAPERGLSRAAVGRASYTIDTNRSLAVEASVKQNGRGIYVKAGYSHARGQHWRAAVELVVIAGRDGDFLGQYRRNSHLTMTARYSF